MLDTRDGILTADLDRYNGPNTALIWSVFAKRAGASAVSAGGDDTDPKPSYDHLAAARNGTLVGKVVNATTAAVVPNARVIVGEYEARVSPAARTSSMGGFNEPERKLPGRPRRSRGSRAGTTQGQQDQQPAETSPPEQA